MRAHEDSKINSGDGVDVKQTGHAQDHVQNQHCKLLATNGPH